MARIRWDTVCKSKVKGGAGMANLSVKNKALLAKWSWRFATEKEALWRKVVLAKYGSNVQRWRFKTTYKKNMSAVWRGIVENAKDEKVSK
ncbi:Electron transfer flavoprotein-ubiquinone oxidoreductase [Gossypium australe]|uniref:Electron transfer flavoprotein-ubiquinone oxidoreductase n=1 Tax=Gossypium australe TaxID=47621 RepID=A0A5B6WJQ8_9ROSI|nr:Electron transfer flavoprotein-ubiquinone oxidoreductase [Gossypium australe]